MWFQSPREKSDYLFENIKSTYFHSIGRLFLHKPFLFYYEILGTALSMKAFLQQYLRHYGYFSFQDYLCLSVTEAVSINVQHQAQINYLNNYIA